jgi:hypothetical protein
MALLTELKAANDSEIRQKTTPNSISPDNTADRLDAIVDELLWRGTVRLFNTGQLEFQPGTNTKTVLVDNVGLFVHESSGTPNGTTIFPAFGGGVWVLKLKPGGDTGGVFFAGSELLSKQEPAADYAPVIAGLLAQASVSRVVIDSEVYEIGGNIIVPPGKTLEFINGGALIGSGNITFQTGAKLEAESGKQIFASGVAISNLQTDDGIVPAEWFGMAGDGTTDDTAAFLKIVRACSANGLTIDLGARTYILDAFELSDAPVISFLSNGARLKLKNNTNMATAEAWRFAGIRRFMIRGKLYLNGNYNGGCRFTLPAANLNNVMFTMRITAATGKTSPTEIDWDSIEFENHALGALTILGGVTSYADAFSRIHIRRMETNSGVFWQNNETHALSLKAVFIYGSHEDVVLDDLVSSDPLGRNFRVGLDAGGSGISNSQSYWTVLTEGSQDSTYKRIRNLFIGRVTSNYDCVVSIGAGFRGAYRAGIGEVSIRDWGRRPGFPDDHYNFTERTRGGIFGKFGDLDPVDGATTSANARTLTLGTVSVKETNPLWVTAYAPDVYGLEVYGSRNMRIEHYDGDVPMAGGANFYDTTYLGGVQVGTWVHTGGNGYPLRLGGFDVDRLIIAKGAYIINYGYIGEIIQQDETQIFFEPQASYDDRAFDIPVNASIKPEANPRWMDIQSAVFRNAKIRIRIEANGESSPYTGRKIAYRSRMRNVKNLQVEVLSNVVGGVQWNASDWTSDVESAWVNLRDYYEFDWENVDFIAPLPWNDAGNIFLTTWVRNNEGGTRARLFDKKDLTKTAGWNFPLAQNRFVNCTMFVDPGTYLFDNTEVIRYATLAELKTKIIPFAKYYLTDAGKVGIFQQDAADTTTAGDDMNVIVGVEGVRLKRSEPYLERESIPAYSASNQSTAYTGAADSEAKLADLNALRVAYENLRASHESIRAALIASGLLTE